MATSISPNTPAGEPPPGEVSNFVNPPSQEGAIIALEAVFITLMMLAVAVRMWVRLGPGPRKNWRVDDTTCVLAAIGSIVHMIVYTQSFPRGFGRHLWDIRAITLLDPSSSRVCNDPASHHRLFTNIEEQILSANGIVYPWVICFAKVSILLLYIRLFWVERTVVIAAWLGIVIDSMLYTAFIGLGIGGLLKCASLTELDSSYCKFNEDGMVMFTSVVNVVTDFYVLLLPVYPVSQLKLNPQKWIGIACVFGSGLAACATSLARLINFAIHQRSSDTLWVQGVNAKYTSSRMSNSYNLEEHPNRKTQDPIQGDTFETGAKHQASDVISLRSGNTFHDAPVSPVSGL
ncbi:hypothetical protein UA08_01150 [Talaromyces atroroseus]|uniref:Rhodopsin domain-containing protein n=1 Tax=Talaromyces atroroseus TaxID=1441469 RepID=A0A1Q5QA68_TALAT|nr:hypothetical protein UA08_01150 [Talaromyces atroroseus]OKL62698.1 hypothetical protein UA08_01150 [Talaromyces atroroseus]